MEMYANNLFVKAVMEIQMATLQHALEVAATVKAAAVVELAQTIWVRAKQQTQVLMVIVSAVLIAEHALL
jgi:hypothetical protein